jgi:hypothetical protein
LSDNHRRCLSVEGDKRLPAEPPALKLDHTVGKIAPGIEESKAGLDSRTVNDSSGITYKEADRICQVGTSFPVILSSDPDELAQCRIGDEIFVASAIAARAFGD